MKLTNDELFIELVKATIIEKKIEDFTQKPKSADKMLEVAAPILEGAYELTEQIDFDKVIEHRKKTDNCITIADLAIEYVHRAFCVDDTDGLDWETNKCFRK
jgi:hypothetical protein